MRFLVAVYLSLAAVAAASTDYREITTYTGPCARALALMAKEGDIKVARDQARALCRSDSTQACPDLWLVYAYCEVQLNAPKAVAVSEEVVGRMPKSAAAHLIHALAIGQDMTAGGLFRALTLIGKIRRAAEKAVECDPDCHPARETLALLYSFPSLVGGDPEKLNYHLTELGRRAPYYAAMAHGMIELERKRKFAAAAAYYREAHRLDPAAHEPVEGLIKTSAAAGNYAEAFALCPDLQPDFPGDGTMDHMFVDLAAQSGLHADEALLASTRYLAAPMGVSAFGRAEMLINTAIILNRNDHNDEADRLVAAAEKQWAGSKKEYQSRRKRYPSQGSLAVTR